MGILILSNKKSNSSDLSDKFYLRRDLQPIDVKNYLHSKGIKASYTRTKIYEHVSALKGYPTATMIYNDLTISIPSLSKATVYNTLNLFVEKNILRAINIESKETRYTVKNAKNNTSFSCKKCSKIIDFCLKIDEEIAKLSPIQGCCVQNFQISLKGFCDECCETV